MSHNKYNFFGIIQRRCLQCFSVLKCWLFACSEDSSDVASAWRMTWTRTIAEQLEHCCRFSGHIIMENHDSTIPLVYSMIAASLNHSSPPYFHSRDVCSVHCHKNKHWRHTTMLSGARSRWGCTFRFWIDDLVEPSWIHSYVAAWIPSMDGPASNLKSFRWAW